MTEEKIHAEEAAEAEEPAAGNKAQPGKVFTEELKVAGDQLVAQVRALMREGNVNHIIIKDKEGKTLIEMPLGLGVVGVLVAPVWAAIGALATLAANYTIVVQRMEE